ncbi:MAG: minD, partial [Clostridia bacterium]|nr:minD [Clostridia bacterium]
SGKGGVGKTTVTANIAACLDKLNKKVLLIDADLRLKNLDIILGLSEKTVFDIEDLFLNRCSFEKTLINHPLHNNLFFISGPLKLSSDISLLFNFIINLANLQVKNFDYILIDCPSGIGVALEEMAKNTVKMIVVATPDLPSVRDAEKTAELAYRKKLFDVRLIVNRIRPNLIRRGLAPDIDNIIDSTSIRLLGLIPEDVRVIINANKGILLTDLKKSRAKTAFENIAARIDGNDVELYKFW